MRVCANYLISQILNFLIQNNELIPSSWVSVEVAHNYECSSWHRNDRLFLSLLDLHTFPSPNQPFKPKVPQKRMRDCLLPHSIGGFPQRTVSVQQWLPLKYLLSFIPFVHSTRQPTHSFVASTMDQALRIKIDMISFLDWTYRPAVKTTIWISSSGHVWQQIWWRMCRVLIVSLGI